MSGIRYPHSATYFYNVIRTRFLLPTILRYVQNINVWNNGLLTPSLHRLQLYKRTFSYKNVDIMNYLPGRIRSSTFEGAFVTFFFEKGITILTDVQNINVWNKGLLTPPLRRRQLYKWSFSYKNVDIMNNLPGRIRSSKFKGTLCSLKMLLQNS